MLRLSFNRKGFGTEPRPSNSEATDALVLPEPRFFPCSGTLSSVNEGPLSRPSAASPQGCLDSTRTVVSYN